MSLTEFGNVFQGNGAIDLPEPQGVAATWHFIKALTGNTHPGAARPFGKLTACCYSAGYSSGYGTHRINCGGPIRPLYDEKKFVGVSHLHQSGIGALGFAFAPELIALFRDDPAVIACGAAALRFQCITFPVQSWIVMSTMMEQSMGRTVPATFLSVARQGFFFIPMVLILPLFLELTGIQMAQSAADLCTLLCALPIHLYVMKHMEK